MLALMSAREVSWKRTGKGSQGGDCIGRTDSRFFSCHWDRWDEPVPICSREICKLFQTENTPGLVLEPGSPDWNADMLPQRHCIWGLYRTDRHSLGQVGFHTCIYKSIDPPRIRSNGCP